MLRPGGTLLIANLNGFNTACGDRDWVLDADGRREHFPIDPYLDERAMWIEYRGIRIVNHHRPLSTYMQALLGAGLALSAFRRAGADRRRLALTRGLLPARAVVPGDGVVQAGLRRRLNDDAPGAR